MLKKLKKVTFLLLLLLSFVGSFVTFQSTSKAENVSQNDTLKVEPQTKNLKFQNNNSNFF